MNSRVLELLKNPKNIQSEDLNLLKEEINSFPYIQNIRALHLYGAHLYDQENYQKELSTTAAYTTDKKILYQLINGKIQQKVKAEAPENKNITKAENGSRYFPKSKTFPIKREELPERTQMKQEESACPTPVSLPEIKHIYVNGERNRILFEGEENFLEENNHETIDLESTLESGTIVTQKQNISVSENPIQEAKAIKEGAVLKEDEIVNKVGEHIAIIPSVTAEDEKAVQIQDVIDAEVSLKENEEAKETENSVFTPEEIINEDKLTSTIEKEEVSNDSELSFHGTESFMPEVKIESNINGELPVSEISQSDFNKHEDEMRRLIEEVEKKMKESKLVAEKEKEEEPATSHDINFAETQSFHTTIKKEEDKSEFNQDPTEANVIEHSEKPEVEINKEVVSSAAVEEVKSEWKPMSFESHMPDSLIKKPTQISQSQEEVAPIELPNEENKVSPAGVISEVNEDEIVEAVKEEQEAQNTDIVEEKKEEAPVMNVSFFSSDISSWTATDNKEEQIDDIEESITSKEESSPENVSSDMVDSNVPGFINTWQSWLKIDRTEKEPEKNIVEIKNKVIESFIENNPKISQLKDESSFVVKEKNDDISHLMTETLAKLYTEQKLYTKAIKAFEILAGKHPGRKSYFEEKIQEVRDIRGKN